jgi:signal transduction histidine kinase
MRRIAELAETEPDSRRFLELSLAELARMPWIVGGRWRSPDGEGAFGRGRGRIRRPSRTRASRWWSTRTTRSRPRSCCTSGFLPASSASSTRRSAAKWRCASAAYLQATHETGARLTHDVKNLLQSLYALISAAPRGSAGDDGYTQLLQRQLPQVTQRLNATLEKLRAPERATTELPMPAREWWAGLERRFAGSGVKLEGDIADDRSVPAPLFDSFVENAIENARAKAGDDPELEISVKFSATADAIALEVRDTGGVLAPLTAQRVFHEPIERDSGLGIGLFHLGRQASDAGYRAELASNVDGDVRFRLSLKV